MSDLGSTSVPPSVSASSKRPLRHVLCVLAWILVGIVIGAGAGGFYEWRHVSNLAASDDQDVREDPSTGFHFTNPLLECDDGADIFSKLYPRLSKNDIQNTIDAAKARGDISFASVYFRDLNVGGLIEINSSELFAPASLLKVSLMMYWLKQSETDPSVLQQNVQFTDDLHGTDLQYFKTQDPVQKGKTYTVADLIQRAITQSDNDAADALVQMATKPNLEKMFQDLHVNLPQDGGDRMSVAEYARFFRLLFNASYLTRGDSEKALQLLSQSTFRSGLVAKLPSNVIVAHKFGERIPSDSTDDTSNNSNDRELHDCGIIYAPGRPYLLCVMTRGNDMDKLASTIADMSKLVYTEVTASP